MERNDASGDSSPVSRRICDVAVILRLFQLLRINSTDFGPQQTPKTPRNRVSELNSGRRVISSSGPIVIAQPNRQKCRGASRSLMSRNSICTTTSARTQTHFFIIRNQLVGPEQKIPGLSLYHYQEIAFQTFVRQQRSNCAIHGGKLSFLMHRKP